MRDRGGRAVIAVTVRDLWLTRLTPEDPPRSWVRTIAYTVLAFAGAFAIVGTAWVFSEQPFMHDGHATYSMNIAMQRAFCGVPSAYDATVNIPELVVQNPEYERVPLRQFAVTVAGSLDKFCATAHPFLNNENSLMLLESAILRISDRTSVRTLFEAFTSLRLLLLGIFLLGLLRSGSSLMVAVPAAAVALECQRMLDIPYALACYPFILPLALGSIGGYAAAWHMMRRGSMMQVLVVATGLGLYVGFFANMRSEYLPLLFVFHGLVVLLIWMGPGIASAERHARALALAVPFMAAYFAFQAAFIWTLPSTGYNYSYHAVAHPLVLGLAIPPNDFAQREGIAWNDSLGTSLARRVDPSVTYLGPTYEHALMTYYWKLWREHPDEMRQIYRVKAEMAGTHAVKSIRWTYAWSRFVRAALATLLWVSSGLVFLVIFASLACLGLWMLLAKRWAVGLPLTLTMGGATFVLIQSMIIMPYFYAQYHGLLLVGLVMLPVLAVQVTLDAAFSVAGFLTRRRALLTPSLAEQP